MGSTARIVHDISSIDGALSRLHMDFGSYAQLQASPWLLLEQLHLG